MYGKTTQHILTGSCVTSPNVPQRPNTSLQGAALWLNHDARCMTILKDPKIPILAGDSQRFMLYISLGYMEYNYIDHSITVIMD